MARKSTVSFLLFAMALSTVSGRSTASDGVEVVKKTDAAVIYEAFLGKWNGDVHSRLDVSLSADSPAQEEIKEYTECADEKGDKHIRWIPATPIPDLGATIGDLSFVHLVDPKQWHPQDPGDLIASGQSVDSAVQTGFAHALMTLSAITFDQSNQTAMFTYAFVCGRLCGNGGIVMFNKTTTGWVMSKHSCGDWIS